MASRRDDTTTQRNTGKDATLGGDKFGADKAKDREFGGREDRSPGRAGDKDTTSAFKDTDKSFAKDRSGDKDLGKDRELDRKDRDLDRKDRELDRKDRELGKDRDIDRKDKDIGRSAEKEWSESNKAGLKGQSNLGGDKLGQSQQAGQVKDVKSGGIGGDAARGVGASGSRA